MSRMTPAKLVAGTKNAPSDGAATPCVTEDVQMPTPEKEDMMSNDTPARPWYDESAHRRLTTPDLARFDTDYARWSADPHAEEIFRGGLVDYIRDQATDQARVRKIMGPHEVPLPEFATVSKHSEWELTEDRTDCVRYLEADSADHRGMSAWLECDQYAVSTRLDLRVRIDEGTAKSPAELTRWALDLLALAGQWTEIEEGQA